LEKRAAARLIRKQERALQKHSRESGGTHEEDPAERVATAGRNRGAGEKNRDKGDSIPGQGP
jgi:hypothetical protein